MWFDVAMGRQGIRSEWSDMPGHVRVAIGNIAGATVIDVSNLGGGFSPGPAARCQLSDGRIVFVKAAGLDLSPISPEMHRQEGRILASLGAGVLAAWPAAWDRPPTRAHALRSTSTRT